MTNELPPLVRHEDDDLLVVNKPAGWNTHSPAPYAGEGIYDWLKNREARWASLAIIHRLDKETSGVLVFSKSRRGNQSLTSQFEKRSIEKRYRLLCDRPVKESEFTLTSTLVRAGSKYYSRPNAAAGQLATTHFRVIERRSSKTLLEAHPVTGRTHQIRVHAADAGVPIVGDTLYGGTPAHRLHLHARTLTCLNPSTDAPQEFDFPEEFDTLPFLALRKGILTDSNLCRLIHGAADSEPNIYLDQLGTQLLLQTPSVPDQNLVNRIKELGESLKIEGVSHKTLTRKINQSPNASPTPLTGTTPDKPFQATENDTQYELRFSEGYSTGIFLDQRDNRRRLLTNYISPGFKVSSKPASDTTVLNTFAYTCAFSVCAARAGYHTTSVDLSRKYLEWGKRNFIINNLPPSDHDFIYGDVFDWMKRFAKRDRKFDVVILDPPTFSRSKVSGTFQAEKHYEALAALAMKTLNPGGTLLCSTNAAKLRPENFMECVRSAAHSSRRSILQEHYAPQPPDFPISREEPGYLKTVWMKLA